MFGLWLESEEYVVSSCRSPAVRSVLVNGNYLVDPASSHMLVSKTKPCMS